MTFASECNNLISSSGCSASIILQADLAGGLWNESDVVGFIVAEGSTTLRGLVRALIIPRILGMRGSAKSFCALAANGRDTDTISFPPSISLSRVALPPLISSLVATATEGIHINSAIIPITCPLL